MRKMKRALAVLLSVILAFSSVSVMASAYDFKVDTASSTGDDFSETPDATKDYNYGITTKFFHKVDGNWVPTDGIVKRGEDVVIRVYIETNFYAGKGELLFAYDGDFFEIQYPDSKEFPFNNTASNPGADLFTSAKTNAASGAAVIGDLVDYEVVTSDDVGDYSFITVLLAGPSAAPTKKLGDLDFSKSGWEDSYIFEIPAKVKANADPDMKGETGDVFVIDKTVCRIGNEDGYVGIQACMSSTTTCNNGLVSNLWHEQTPLLQSDPQKVVNDVVFFANGGEFSDSESKLVECGYIGDSVAAAEACSYFGFDAPTKDNCSFKGWAECNEDGEIEGTPVLVEKVDVDYTVNNYAAVWGEAAPTVTINANGGKFPSGSETAEFSGEPGDELDIGNSVPTKDGYTQNGWSTDPDATTGSDLPATIPDSSTTYYAVWTPNEYSLSYYIPTDVPNAEFAAYGNPENHACDSDITYASAPAKNFLPRGYSFDSWKVYDEDSKTYTDAPEKMPAGDLKVYAYCTPDSNSVKYYVDGKIVGDFSLDTDSSIPVTDPSFFPEGSPAYGDDTFDGWYTNEACTEKLPDGALTPAGGITLYAKTKIPATFKLDGGNIGGKTDDITDTYSFGADITAPDDPEKTGYEFKGWNPTVGTMDSKDGKTFTATWEKKSYNITFTVDGEDDVVPVPYGADPEDYLPDDPEDTAGRTFKGWDLNGDGVITDADKFPETMPDSEIKAVAVFEGLSYDITYHIKDETDPAHKNTYGYEAAVTEWKPEDKEGYEFDGWYESSDCEGTKWTAPAKMPGNDIDVYGKYNKKQFKVTYVLDDETVNEENVTYGDPIPSYRPEIDWTWADKDGTLSAAPTTMPASDLTVTGSASSYKKQVKYHIDGTTEDPDHSDYVSVGADITPWEAPAKTGYTFKGWFSDPEMTADYTFGKMPETDVDVYGKYEINKNTISYFVDDAPYGDPVEVEYGDDVTAPEEPTKENYTFSGWKWYDEDGNEIEKPSTMPDYPITAKGTFKADEYTVSYYTDSETTPAKTDSLKVGDTVTAPSDPTRTGFTFNGWKWYDKDGAEIAKPDTMPAQNVVAIAQWTVNPHKITYKLEGGNIGGNTNDIIVDINFGEALPAQTDPVNDELVFAGWKWFDSKGNEISKPASMIDDDLTAKAQWKEPGPDEFELSYTVDGETYDAYTLPVGAELPDPEKKPVKLGYIFKGWKWLDKDGNEIEKPATMPEGNVEAQAEFIRVPIAPLIVIPSIAAIIPAAAAIAATPAVIGIIDALINNKPGTDPTEPTNPDVDPENPTGSDDEPGTESSDIPDTGSVGGGIAAFAAISVAAATAYVIVSKKKDDED